MGDSDIGTEGMSIILLQSARRASVRERWDIIKLRIDLPCLTTWFALSRAYLKQFYCRQQQCNTMQPRESQTYTACGQLNNVQQIDHVLFNPDI